MEKEEEKSELKEKGSRRVVRPANTAARVGRRPTAMWVSSIKAWNAAILEHEDLDDEPSAGLTLGRPAGPRRWT